MISHGYCALPHSIALSCPLRTSNSRSSGLSIPRSASFPFSKTNGADKGKAFTCAFGEAVLASHLPGEAWQLQRWEASTVRPTPPLTSLLSPEGRRPLSPATLAPPVHFSLAQASLQFRGRGASLKLPFPLVERGCPSSSLSPRGRWAAPPVPSPLGGDGLPLQFPLPSGEMGCPSSSLSPRGRGLG